MAKKENKRNIFVRIVCAILAFLMFGTTIVYVIYSIVQSFKG